MKKDNQPSKYPLSPFIREQAPEWVRDDHGAFLDFLEEYYKWMETSDNPVRRTGMLEDLSDIDESLESFYTHFKNEYLNSFPVKLAIDKNTGEMVSKETLVKNVKEFYGAKGTERSFKFLFRVLYDAYLEFYYPKTDIFRVSDGNWIAEKSIKVTIGSGQIAKMQTRQIRQRNERTKEVEAYARCTKVLQYREGRYDVAELFIDDIYGTFEVGRQIECTILLDDGNTETIFETVYPVLQNISVLTGGSGYEVDQRVTIGTNVFGSGAQGQLDTVSPRGALSYVKTTNFGVAYDPTKEQPTFTIDTVKGTGAAVTGEYGALCEYEGYWSGNDGKLSSNKKIQDNYYYQTFSYVLKSEMTLGVFKETVKKIIHPAGLKMFANVLILRDHQNDIKNRTYQYQYEIPLLGHYTPYTFKTWENLRSNLSGDGVDLYPCGHNPTTGNGIANYSDEFESGTVKHSPTGPRLGDSMQERISMQFNTSGSTAPTKFATGDWIIQSAVTGETGLTGVSLTGGSGEHETAGFAVGYITSKTKNNTGNVFEIEVISHGADNYHFMTGSRFFHLTGTAPIVTGGSIYTGPLISGGVQFARHTGNDGFATGGLVTGVSGFHSDTITYGPTAGNFHMVNILDANLVSGTDYVAVEVGESGPLTEGEWSANEYWAIYPHPRVRSITGIHETTDYVEVGFKLNDPYEAGKDFKKHEIVTQHHPQPYDNYPVSGLPYYAVGHVVEWRPAAEGVRGSRLILEQVQGKFTQFGTLYGWDNGTEYGNALYNTNVNPDDYDDLQFSSIYRTGNTTFTQFKHIQIQPFVRILKGDIFDSGIAGQTIPSGATGVSAIETTCPTGGASGGPQP